MTPVTVKPEQLLALWVVPLAAALEKAYYRATLGRMDAETLDIFLEEIRACVEYHADHCTATKGPR